VLAIVSSPEILADRINLECKKQNRPELTKQIFNNSDDIAHAVMAGRLDALIDDATASSYFEKTSGHKLVVVPGIYDVAPEGRAIKKGDVATEKMMLSALGELVKNGTYQKILARYGMEKYGIEPYLADKMSAIHRRRSWSTGRRPRRRGSARMRCSSAWGCRTRPRPIRANCRVGSSNAWHRAGAGDESEGHPVRRIDVGARSGTGR
jgi:hypothetical protein